MLLIESEFMIEDIYPADTYKGNIGVTFSLKSYNGGGAVYNDIFNATAWNNVANRLPELKKGDIVSVILNLKNVGTPTSQKLSLSIKSMYKKRFSSSLYDIK